MNIKSGVDIVYLPKFKNTLSRGGENFLRRVFLEQELGNPEVEVEHLAGIFAAKEAVIKALGLPTDSWHDILITKKPSGTPEVKFPASHPLREASLPSLGFARDRLLTSSLSISHDGHYVVAQFLVILK